MVGALASPAMAAITEDVPAAGPMHQVRRAVRTLAPGYFALVMGSGIISVGMRLQGFEVLSQLLAWICGFAYALLLVLTAWRLLRYRSEVLDEFTDARRAFGYFTFVAGTNV